MEMETSLFRVFDRFRGILHPKKADTIPEYKEIAEPVLGETIVAEC